MDVFILHVFIYLIWFFIFIFSFYGAGGGLLSTYWESERVSGALFGSGQRRGRFAWKDRKSVTPYILPYFNSIRRFSHSLYLALLTSLRYKALLIWLSFFFLLHLLLLLLDSFPSLIRKVFLHGDTHTQMNLLYITFQTAVLFGAKGKNWKMKCPSFEDFTGRQ